MTELARSRPRGSHERHFRSNSSSLALVAVVTDGAVLNRDLASSVTLLIESAVRSSQAGATSASEELT
jgi:hypothetical protein